MNTYSMEMTTGEIIWCDCCKSHIKEGKVWFVQQDEDVNEDGTEIMFVSICCDPCYKQTHKRDIRLTDVAGKRLTVVFQRNRHGHTIQYWVRPTGVTALDMVMCKLIGIGRVKDGELGSSVGFNVDRDMRQIALPARYLVTII